MFDEVTQDLKNLHISVNKNIDADNATDGNCSCYFSLPATFTFQLRQKSVIQNKFYIVGRYQSHGKV